MKGGGGEREKFFHAEAKATLIRTRDAAAAISAPLLFPATTTGGSRMKDADLSGEKKIWLSMRLLLRARVYYWTLASRIYYSF